MLDWLYKRYVFNQKESDMDKKKLFKKIIATMVVVATAGIIIAKQPVDVAVMNALGLAGAFILGKAYGKCCNDCK